MVSRATLFEGLRRRDEPQVILHDLRAVGQLREVLELGGLISEHLRSLLVQLGFHISMQRDVVHQPRDGRRSAVESCDQKGINVGGYDLSVIICPYRGRDRSACARS